MADNPRTAPAPKLGQVARTTSTTDQALADERTARTTAKPVDTRTRVVVPAVVQAENPPRQPAMIPAEQVYGARGNTPPRAPGRPLRPASAGIKVQAIKMGYYDDKLRRVGDVFTIRDESEYSHVWMVEVAAGTPERITSSNEDLRRQHDHIVGERLGIETGPDTPTGALDPLGYE